jgi:hypothetical protein
MVSAGLCSVAGILPDLDSDSGVPVRETMAFVAATIPALMIPRFVQLGFDVEHIALATGLIYLAIRFGASDLFKRYTVHRGMWHSLPAAAIAGLLTFLIVSGSTLEIRLFKTAAVVLGFLVHLTLDEIWSIEVRRGKMRIKKSFGTALKFWTTKSLWPNVSTYGKLALLVAVLIGDPYLMEQLGVQQPEFFQQTDQWLQTAAEDRERWMPNFIRGKEQGSAETVESLNVTSQAEETYSPADNASWSVVAPEVQEPPPLFDPPAAETARRAYDYPAIRSPDRR